LACPSVIEALVVFSTSPTFYGLSSKPLGFCPCMLGESVLINSNGPLLKLTLGGNGRLHISSL